MNAMPPDPAFRGETWREEWLARLEATPPWLIEWLRQQHDGPYWRPGSLAPDYDAIEAAILNVGGWMDSYVDAALRMQAACTAPSRTIVGNWVHGLPSSATPGPNLDELHELVRFFDRWLKGIPNGADARAGGRLVRARVRRTGAVPGRRCPGAGGRRRPIRTRRPRATEWRFARRVAAARRPARSAAEDAREGPAASRLASIAIDHRPDRRHARRPVVGRRRATERPGPRPSTRRGARPDLHVASRSTSRGRDPRRARGRAPSRGLGPGRDGGRSTDRCRPGRDLRAGQRRDPQPDPPSLARAPGAARARPRRGDPRRPAARRLPVPAGPSDPGLGGVVGLAGHLAVAVSRPSSPSTTARPPRRGSSCRSSRRPVARATRRSRPSRRRPPTQPEVGGEGDADEPVWRITTDVIAGTTSRSPSTMAARTCSTTAGGSTRRRR